MGTERCSVPPFEIARCAGSDLVERIVKELPLEYAIEMNRLIQIQMEGSVG
jgi:Fe-S cluster assembly protein SufB